MGRRGTSLGAMNTVTTALVALLLVGCGDDSAGAGSGGSGGSGAGSTTGGGDAGGSGGAGTGAASAGAASAGGAGGANVGGAGGAPVGSDGCGQAPSDPSEAWVQKSVQVGAATRDYFVYLPPGYDPSHAYPVVYQFHGCSGNVDKQNNNPPVQNESGADAILVRGRAVADCWDSAPGGPDVLFFDALLAEVESTWCADVDRRFAAGYSSGSFMTHRLACDRGDVLRGVASIAGGMAGNNCLGQTAALLIHDDTDPQVNISASESARDRHLANNGCDATTTPTDPSPCVIYAGCDVGYPVVWCQTTGQGHSRQDGLSAPAFWGFLSAL